MFLHVDGGQLMRMGGVASGEVALKVIIFILNVFFCVCAVFLKIGIVSDIKMKVFKTLKKGKIKQSWTDR